jgi:hypothetical protein
MGKQRYTTSPTPHITIDVCGGDLLIEGSAASEIIFDLDEDSSRVEREGETLRVNSGGDCRIACPPASTVTLQQVGGDLNISDLTSTLAVENAAADVSLRGAGVVTFTHVGGDLSARDVNGDLRIDAIGGDLEVRRIDGQLIVGGSNGDLSARNLSGGARINCAGDVSLETNLVAGKTYSVSAGGDITLRVPPDAGATFDLNAGGEIEKRIEFNEWAGDRHSGKGRIGEGTAVVTLNAGGDLTVLPTREDFDFEAIGEQLEAKMGQFERELEAKMADLSKHIAQMATAGVADLDSRLRRVDVDGITRRATERAAERARRQAERVTERLRQQAERQAERARRQAEHARRHAERHGKWGFVVASATPPRPPAPPGKASQPATESERLMILRMLEQKKISTEEAAKLLEALES